MISINTGVVGDYHPPSPPKSHLILGNVLIQSFVKHQNLIASIPGNHASSTVMQQDSGGIPDFFFSGHLEEQHQPEDRCDPHLLQYRPVLLQLSESNKSV